MIAAEPTAYYAIPCCKAVIHLRREPARIVRVRQAWAQRGEGGGVQVPNHMVLVGESEHSPPLGRT